MLKVLGKSVRGLNAKVLSYEVMTVMTVNFILMSPQVTGYWRITIFTHIYNYIVFQML